MSLTFGLSFGSCFGHFVDGDGDGDGDAEGRWKMEDYRDFSWENVDQPNPTRVIKAIDFKCVLSFEKENTGMDKNALALKENSIPQHKYLMMI